MIDGLCSEGGLDVRVKVEFTSILRELVGCSEIEIECQGDLTLTELQEKVVEKFGGAVTGKVQEYQWRHKADYTVVALNDEVVEPEDMPRIKLKDGDVVTFLPAIAGG